MQIQQVINDEMAKSKKILLEFPWTDPVAYGMWLSQTYYMVSHSTRLVAMAGAYVQIGKESLHARFVDHSKEERGHQLVCISDIKALGFELENFPKTLQSQAMYQIQYYWIQHRGAASFFGYALALECLAEHFGPQVAKTVLDAHGTNASKFLKLHSEDDQEHTAEAYKHLKNLTVDEERAVVENFILSSEIYRSMLLESQVRAKSLSLKKKLAA